MIKNGSLLLIMLILTACAKENPVTIAQLFERPDCSGECYMTMPCEGKEMTLKVYLTGTNVMANGANQLFMRDPDDIYKTIQINLDESISPEIIKKIDDEFDQTVFIRGIVSGYDLLNQEFCKRAHIITVQSPEDIWFE